MLPPRTFFLPWHHELKRVSEGSLFPLLGDLLENAFSYLTGRYVCRTRLANLKLLKELFYLLCYLLLIALLQKTIIYRVQFSTICVSTLNY